MVTAPKPRPRLTVAEAIRVIKEDGHVAGQQDDGLYFAYWDAPPSLRYMAANLSALELIDYAEFILHSYEVRSREG